MSEEKNELALKLLDDLRSKASTDPEAYEAALFDAVANGAIPAQYEMTHLTPPGIYYRKIRMKAGSVLIGHEHTEEHLNVVMCGKAAVWIEGRRELLDATRGPIEFTSGAGVRKMLEIYEDMEWATIHPNPENIQDVSVLEERISVHSETFKAATEKGLPCGEEVKRLEREDEK